MAVIQSNIYSQSQQTTRQMRTLQENKNSDVAPPPYTPKILLTSIRSTLGQRVNQWLGKLGLKLVQSNPYEDYRDYIPLQKTIDDAKSQGLPLGDYIDIAFNVPGSTQLTIDKMRAIGVFDLPISQVCEIGPGTGRYLEKVMQIIQVKHYEIYETSEEWKNWLIQQYPVTPQVTDGCSLRQTPDHCIDLMHTHKVLAGQPSLTICSYLAEMARVTKPSGKIVFDIVTENCMDDATLAAWWSEAGSYQHYPCLFPRQFAIDFLAGRDCKFDGSFIIPMKPGNTEYLVFTKKSGKPV
ncbi:methyltransferase domain-containing protein [Synechococcales cyanobacterium C]|uniref:Methyltransferase domain-containing protein n=1 Tax=Petrachloros mirabilis ULC683 TaxID=2781853 RepID=A0A8K2A850_9CYAN|nr:methyltransferase domain-containing protein [Petrachloros mirabilis]NCJ07611.1 methyltransferase domain-containing protein [Petrachloros mirabilis ULC683]